MNSEHPNDTGANLTSFDFAASYRTSQHDPVVGFYKPCLSCANNYDRAVGHWNVTAHRDLDSIVTAWNSACKHDQLTGVIHVGFTRSDTAAFEDLTNLFPCKMLLTAPALYAFARVGTCAPGIARTVDGVPVYVALSGWGYETTSEEIGLSTGLNPTPECDSCHFKLGTTENSSCQWLSNYAERYPHDAESMKAAGITDDESYLNFEHGLDEDFRIKLGRYRFQCLSMDIYLNCPNEIVSIAPPWVCDLPIGQAGFRVRACNVFSREGIMFIKDLAGYTNNQLLMMEHLGRRSITEIAQTLLDVIGVLPQSAINNENVEVGIPIETCIPNSRQKVVESDSLEGSLLELLRSMEKNVAIVMRRRMGFGTKQQTLEEIAGLLGVTRERVRQIEKKVCVCEENKQFWKKRIEEPIKKGMDNRESPLPVVALDVIDQWFTNIGNIEEPFRFVLEKFCSNTLHVIQINGISYISMITQDEWDSLVKNAVNVLEGGATLCRWTEAEAKQTVSEILSRDCREFADDLFYTASKNAVFTTIDNTDVPVLTSIGRIGAEAYVVSVLAESDRPLHFSEIAEKLSAKGRSIEIRRAHNAAAEIGLLYGRGIYGLMQHYPLDEEETIEIVAEAEDIIGSGLNGRQWHCSEILKILGERGLDMDGRLDHYIVNIALMRSKLLANLGRLVWASGTASRLTSADRIEIIQAIESLLLMEGRPLSGSEIRERLLMEGRGLSRFLQIQNVGNVVRLGPNYWGLADRDIPFSQEHQALIREIFEDRLQSSQKGMHKTELYEALKDFPGIEIYADSDPALFVSIALRSDRMRYANGNYLYLGDWGDARRMTVEDAARIALEQAGSTGLRAQELRDATNRIIGYQISIHAIYGPLSAIGARYNLDTGYWQVVGDGKL